MIIKTLSLKIWMIEHKMCFIEEKCIALIANIRKEKKAVNEQAKCSY